MAGFLIESIRLHRVTVPLKHPFTTHLQTVTERESIVVEMTDCSGVVGLGECVAFSSPWYTEETVQSCWDALVNWLIPSVLHKEIEHPSMISNHYEAIKGNHMAKAALDQAAWDLFARKQQMPLWKVLGGVHQQVDAGVVVTWATETELEHKTEQAIKIGYKRIKIKINASTNEGTLEKVIKRFPSTLFFADANGSFSNADMVDLQRFDTIGLTLIEQPFKEDEWDRYVEASRLLTTPIALDESLCSYRDVEDMITKKAGAIVVLKPGRMGGTTESLRVHDLCLSIGIPIWLGGMIDFGISKAHSLALATLPGVTLPGDFSASTHFWDEDLIQPPIVLKDGCIELADYPGIGVSLDYDVLKKHCIALYTS